MWCSKYLCILAQDVCLPDKIRMCICMRKMLTLLLPGVLGRENQYNCIDFTEPAPDLHVWKELIPFSALSPCYRKCGILLHSRGIICLYLGILGLWICRLNSALLVNSPPSFAIDASGYRELRNIPCLLLVKPHWEELGGDSWQQHCLALMQLDLSSFQWVESMKTCYSVGETCHCYPWGRFKSNFQYLFAKLAVFNAYATSGWTVLKKKNTTTQ